MDLRTEIKKHKIRDIEAVLKKLTAKDKCVVCNKITTHKDGKLQRNCYLNVYNEHIRALLCEQCNCIENNVRRYIESSHMSYEELLKKYDKDKIMNLFENVYNEVGIVPMITD